MDGPGRFKRSGSLAKFTAMRCATSRFDVVDRAAAEQVTLAIPREAIRRAGLDPRRRPVGHSASPRRQASASYREQAVLSKLDWGVGGLLQRIAP